MGILRSSLCVWLACALCLIAPASAFSSKRVKALSSAVAASSASSPSSSSQSSTAAAFDPTRNENPHMYVRLHKAAKEEGAVCLDGTPAAYYLKPGNSSNWMILLQGGAWCKSLQDCYNRSRDELGSSKAPQSFVNWAWQGFGSSNMTLNPEFANWTKVYVPYCDGASFSGDVEDPVAVNGELIYFRGKRIFKAVIQHLLSTTEMNTAKEVVLWGISAGGLATLLNIDYMRTLLPSSIALRGMSDAGYFPDLPNLKEYNWYRDWMRTDFSMQNGISDHDCQLAYPTGHQCFMAQYLFPFIQTPMFILNSQYDVWQLQNIMVPDNDTKWAQCTSLDPHTCDNARQMTAIQNYRNSFMETLQPVINNTKGHGAFLHSCFVHVEGLTDTSVVQIKVKGRSILQAFGDWYYNRNSQPYITIDDVWPNNPSCQSIPWVFAPFN